MYNIKFLLAIGGMLTKYIHSVCTFIDADKINSFCMYMYTVDGINE